MALTMLSRRGRREGGALCGRRYVKKNLCREEVGAQGPSLWNYVPSISNGLQRGLGKKPHAGTRQAYTT